MKRHFYLIISLLCFTVSATAQRYMKVEKNDGTIVEVPVADVQRVFFDDRTSVGFCPDSNHPHMIDLGIGTLWACCNVGASSPEEYGNYYAWGETQPKSEYSFANYQYVISSDECANLGSDISGTPYDVARVIWGAPWRIPTVEECQAMIDHCSFVWTDVNGVSGCKVTGPNGGIIFLPAAGYYMDNLDCVGLDGYYYTSIPLYSNWAWSFDLQVGLIMGRGFQGGDYRPYGHSIRPVR